MNVIKELRNSQSYFTFDRAKSENRWLKGWKKGMSFRMYLDTLMASSILFGFNRGPSIKSCKTSKFHLV